MNSKACQVQGCNSCFGNWAHWCRNCGNKNSTHFAHDCPLRKGCKVIGCTFCKVGENHYCRNCHNVDSNHFARNCPTLVKVGCGVNGCIGGCEFGKHFCNMCECFSNHTIADCPRNNRCGNCASLTCDNRHALDANCTKCIGYPREKDEKYKASGVVFVCKGDILLIQEWSKRWNTGAVGGVESCDKDQPTETALREMREEIGVELSDSVKLYPLDVRHYRYGMTRLFFCFLDSKNDIVVKPDNKEIIDYKWENLNKVMNNDMRGTSKDSWNAVVEFIVNH
jgi:8-oxo-dGTP pyrophosphatase MutT (NUDIX family)